MSLISVIVVLIVVGILLWLVQSYLPIAEPIKKIITAVVVIAVVLWLLNVFGLLGPIGTVQVPRVR